MVSIWGARRILRENIADLLTDYPASPNQLVLSLGPKQRKGIDLLASVAGHGSDITDG